MKTETERLLDNEKKTSRKMFEFLSSPDIQKEEWDDFVKNSPYGSIHQISAWEKFQRTIPGRSIVRGFGVRDTKTKKILAVTFCVRMDTGFLKKYWWYSARGPVFDPINEHEREAGIFLIQKISESLKREGGMFWRFDPYFTKEEYASLHLANAKITTQNYQPTDTLVIDLSKTNEQLLAEMKRKGRYNIKLAQEKGVRVSAIENGKFSQQDLDDFWRLNTETTSRDSFSGHEKKYYGSFLRELKNYAVLFFAEFEGVRIATAIFTFYADKAIYYFGASTSDERFRPLMAPYLLQWEMMQCARKKNCKTYDFLGIAPEDELDHPYAGISEFKWKFGGSRQTYSAGKEIIFEPVWYKMYRMRKGK